MKYKIITEPTLEDLQFHVQVALDLGWLLHEGVFVSLAGYSQALKK